MSTRKRKTYRFGLGEILLMIYLLAVIIIAILRAVTGFPTISELDSSPALLMHGEWWRLATSAFVIDGPPIPQVIAIGVLGTLGIYFGGSWTFWSTALAGHFLGTLIAYGGIALVWVQNHDMVARYITDPDYGVSLIWCAALGAFAGMVWFGNLRWNRVQRMWVIVLALSIMVLVTVMSDKMDAIQHTLAFLIGGLIVGTAGRSVKIERSRRPMLAQVR